MNTTTNVIKLRNIVRDFKLGAETIQVLRSIDLDINRGEYVALMGPSGSGKSTFMNLLGCLDVPTRGSLFLEGVEISSLSQKQLAGIRESTFYVEIGEYFSFLKDRYLP
jgi:putative ABC transport system ATP-binding protein